VRDGTRALPRTLVHESHKPSDEIGQRRAMTLTRILALSVLAIAWPMNSLAQAPSTDQVNEANNP
jgi:hypothetical protein